MPRWCSPRSWRRRRRRLSTPTSRRGRRRPGETLTGWRFCRGSVPLIADTQEEAERLVLELNGLADPEVGRRRLSGRFGGFDFGHLELDRELTPADFPDPDNVQAARSRAATIVGLVERERPTLRQLLAKLAGARGHYTFAGTPEQVADFMAEWLRDGAADGFNLMPPVLPWMLDAFIERVLPILRERGLYRQAYSGSTLRAHYGLARPAPEVPPGARAI